MERPESFEMISEVKCRRDLTMYCLASQEKVTVPKGTVVTRFRRELNDCWYVYEMDGKQFEVQPGMRYLPIGRVYVKAKSVFG